MTSGNNVLKSVYTHLSEFAAAMLQELVGETVMMLGPVLRISLSTANYREICMDEAVARAVGQCIIIRYLNTSSGPWY